MGAVAADVELETLQKLTMQAKPMGGYATMVTDKGTYIAHSKKPELIGNNIFDVDKTQVDILDRIAKGEQFQIHAKSKTTGLLSLKSYSPITFNGIDIKWSFVSVIPHEKMYAEYNVLFRAIVGMNIIVTLVVIVVIFMLVKKAIYPVTLACNHMEILSDADFTLEVPEKYLETEDEIGRLGKSTRDMLGVIENVTGAANEGANGTSNIAEKTNIVSQNANKSRKLAEQTKSENEKLVEMVSKFGV